MVKVKLPNGRLKGLEVECSEERRKDGNWLRIATPNKGPALTIKIGDNEVGRLESEAKDPGSLVNRINNEMQRRAGPYVCWASGKGFHAEGSKIELQWDPRIQAFKVKPKEVEAAASFKDGGEEKEDEK